LKRIIEFLRWRLGLTPEARSRRALVRLGLGPGDLGVDCGANVGDMTQVLAMGGATVHAFEPNPHAFAVLERRFRGWQSVVCHNAAAGCRNGRAALYLHENSASNEVLWSNGSSLLSEKPNVSHDRSVDVDVVDLADFLLGLGREVRVLKMDIEGAEVEVLTHLLATGTLERVREAFIETHEKKIPALAGATQALRSRLANHPHCRVHFDWV
jgi:FkbM family methyltransferase